MVQLQTRRPQIFPLRLGIILAQAVVLWLLVPILGCGSPARQPPKVYPVQGKVQYKDGKAVTGGLVEFRSETETGVVANGRIGTDGSFTLVTLFENSKLEGAPAGSHKVTYHPFQGQEQSTLPPFTLPKAVVVNPQDQNVLVIELDRPKKN